MSDSKIAFPGIVSRSNISSAVVELMKLLLYQRGQFPSPLDEARKMIDQNMSNHGGHYGELNSEIVSGKPNFVIFEDPPVQMAKQTCTREKENGQNYKSTITKKIPVPSFTHYEDSPVNTNESNSAKRIKNVYEDPYSKNKLEKPKFIINEDSPVKTSFKQRERKLNVARQKAEKQFLAYVVHFEDMFGRLKTFLECNDITEVVLNLGQNIRQPKEVFHIKLPLLCKNCECSKDSLSLKKCKLYLTKAIIENEQLRNDSVSETLTTVSIVMMIPSHMLIEENMEQKPVYKIPTKGKLHRLELTSLCSHKSSTPQDFEDKSQTGQRSNVWVQLKPVIKGFKDNITPKASENSIWL